MLELPVGVSSGGPVGLVVVSVLGRVSPGVRSGSVPVTVVLAPMELVVLSPRAFVVAGPADSSPPAPDGVTPATRPLLGLVPVPAGSALLTPAALAPVLVTLVVLVPVSVVSVFGVPVSEARVSGALLMPG